MTASSRIAIVTGASRGLGAAMAEQLALQGQLELRVLQLPSGKDPDEFLKSQGAGDYRALLDQAPLWLERGLWVEWIWQWSRGPNQELAVQAGH